MLTPWKESYDQPRQHIKKQRHYFANKGLSGQGYGFSSGYVWMWVLNCEESWAPKNWCFWTVVLEKILESPLDCKEIQLVHPKGDQSWVFTERTDVEAETPIVWSPDAKSWLIGKHPDSGKDWRQEEKGTTEDEMVGWHHQLNGHGFGWTPGAGDGQGGLACCDSWGLKELDTTEWLNWTELNPDQGYQDRVKQRAVNSSVSSCCTGDQSAILWLLFKGMVDRERRGVFLDRLTAIWAHWPSVYKQ